MSESLKTKWKRELREQTNVTAEEFFDDSNMGSLRKLNPQRQKSNEDNSVTFSAQLADERNNIRREISIILNPRRGHLRGHLDVTTSPHRIPAKNETDILAIYPEDSDQGLNVRVKDLLPTQEKVFTRCESIYAYDRNGDLQKADVTLGLNAGYGDRAQHNVVVTRELIDAAKNQDGIGIRLYPLNFSPAKEMTLWVDLDRDIYKDLNIYTRYQLGLRRIPRSVQIGPTFPVTADLDDLMEFVRDRIGLISDRVLASNLEKYGTLGEPEFQ